MITCPQCGKLNPENFNYCLDCGAELHPEETHSAESQFFLDLSAESPDVKKARVDAGIEQTPTPEPDALIGGAPRPITPLSTKPPVQVEPKPAPLGLPGHTPLELSPDDLMEDMDDELDVPLDKASKSEPPSAVEADSPFAEFSENQVDFDMDQAAGDSFIDEPMADEPVADEPLAEESLSQAEDLFADDMDDDDHGEIDLLQDEDELLSTQGEQLDKKLRDSAPERHTLKPEDDPSDDLPDFVEEDRVDLEQDLEVEMSQAEEIRCIKCNAELKKDDKFCWQCGAKAGPQAAEASGQTMFMHVGTSDSLEAEVVAKLVILEPSGREGRSFNLTDGENLCGRTCDSVLLDDRFVSPTHCSFDYAEGRMQVTDRESTNGVFLKVKGQMPLKSGLMLRIGQQLLMFQKLEDFDIDPASMSPDDTLFFGSPTNSIWGKLVHITRDGRVLGQYTLNSDSLIIGREVGDILFPQDGFVSGTHAKITLKDGHCVVMDMGSSNGTFIQVKEHTLNNNDLVLVGKKLMRFEFV
jgi:pSer/pThr/pTyr-binding forkhead associated (FHA) protein